MDELKQLVTAWLDKAENDLLSAQRLMSFKNPTTDTISFHCRQAIEKFLKAYLVVWQVDFSKSHDLEYLLTLCIETEPDFVQFEEEVRNFEGFAVEYRYPYFGSISDREVSKALETAKAVQHYVQNILDELQWTQKIFISVNSCSLVVIKIHLC